MFLLPRYSPGFTVGSGAALGVRRESSEPGETGDVTRLSRAGLLRAAEGSMIGPLAVFVPADARGVTRSSRSGRAARSGRSP